MTKNTQITHNQETQHFTLTVDGQYAGKITYQFDTNGAMVIDHTFVDKAYGGHGLAKQLVLAGIDFAKQEQLTIVPQCSYVAAFFKRYPEYADLLGK